jgi:hypothetical protein
MFGFDDSVRKHPSTHRFIYLMDSKPPILLSSLASHICTSSNDNSARDLQGVDVTDFPVCVSEQQDKDEPMTKDFFATAPATSDSDSLLPKPSEQPAVFIFSALLGRTLYTILSLSLLSFLEILLVFPTF